MVTWQEVEVSPYWGSHLGGSGQLAGDVGLSPLPHLDAQHLGRRNLFIYQARESSLVHAGFLTAHFLQKT